MTDLVYKTIGYKLREMRLNSKVRKAVLARAMNCCVRTLHDYETDVSDVPTKKLIAACICCNFNIVKMFTGLVPNKLLSNIDDEDDDNDNDRKPI